MRVARFLVCDSQTLTIMVGGLAINYTIMYANKRKMLRCLIQQNE